MAHGYMWLRIWCGQDALTRMYATSSRGILHERTRLRAGVRAGVCAECWPSARRARWRMLCGCLVTWGIGTIGSGERKTWHDGLVQGFGILWLCGGALVGVGGARRHDPDEAVLCANGHEMPVRERRVVVCLVDRNGYNGVYVREPHSSAEHAARRRPSARRPSCDL